MTIKTSLATFLLGIWSASGQYQPVPETAEENPAVAIGHNGLKYRIVRDWAKVDRTIAPVINSHAMVEGNDGLFYLVTDHPKNAVIVFDSNGTYLRSIGKGLQGGHGIDVIQDRDEELLIHVDCGWDFSAGGKATKAFGSINILKKDGTLVRTFPSPVDLGLTKEGTFYGPCDVAVTPNNTILVVDGYGSNIVLEFTLEGKLLHHWGGTQKDDPASIQNGHGISIDHADPENPVVWVSSRSENKLKTFTLKGKHLESIDLPGAYAGQAVFHGDAIYTGVCWSKDSRTNRQAANSGFVLVLDRKTRKVISAPGGIKPVYLDGKLQPMKQELRAFRHVHDLMVDKQGNIYVMEWNAGCRYPTKLELVTEER